MSARVSGLHFAKRRTRENSSAVMALPERDSTQR
jgi:hypothetical protein